MLLCGHLCPDSLDHGRNDRHAADNVYCLLGLFHKVYACGTLAGIVLTTTKVNEFLSAMNRVRAPKKLVIPMAVMLRYIPTIQEDWRYITDAMRMRDVSPSLGAF